LNSPKELELRSIFKLFEENSIDYIVLRGFTDIPDKVSYTNDLDLLCSEKDKKKIALIFKKLDYSFYLDSKRNNLYLYHALPHFHYRNKKKDIHIDIVFNLSYRSPNKGEWVSVHEEIQESIWLNKVVVEQFWLFQPSYLDEFIHLICHSVFDKKEFRQKDIQRINEIYLHIDKRKVLYLFNLIFFKYSSTLLEQIDSMEYDSIIPNYLKFKDY
jgi:hypothetical protein